MDAPTYNHKPNDNGDKDDNRNYHLNQKCIKSDQWLKGYISLKAIIFNVLNYILVVLI